MCIHKPTMLVYFPIPLENFLTQSFIDLFLGPIERNFVETGDFSFYDSLLNYNMLWKFDIKILSMVQSQSSCRKQFY